MAWPFWISLDFHIILCLKIYWGLTRPFEDTAKLRCAYKRVLWEDCESGALCILCQRSCCGLCCAVRVSALWICQRSSCESTVLSAVGVLCCESSAHHMSEELLHNWPQLRTRQLFQALPTVNIFIQLIISFVVFRWSDHLSEVFKINWNSLALVWVKINSEQSFETHCFFFWQNSKSFQRANKKAWRCRIWS